MVKKLLSFILLTYLFLIASETHSQDKNDPRFLSFIAEPSTVQFFWKDEGGQIFGSLGNLKRSVERGNGNLVFAMNGGMFMKDNFPQGLFIENGSTIKQLDTLSGSGNFYMKPNGVFYISNNGGATVCETKKFKNTGDVRYATQSGPMLVIDGKIHPSFIKGSHNLHIRNGVGILPDNRIVFAISKVEVNFYDFAEYFKKMGCRSALYLDGFVSRAYLPEKNWEQLDGNFGVIIGVIK